MEIDDFLEESSNEVATQEYKVETRRTADESQVLLNGKVVKSFHLKAEDYACTLAEDHARKLRVKISNGEPLDEEKS
jgi:hypothetical protein